MKLLVYSDLHLDMAPFTPQLGPYSLKTTEDTGVLQKGWL